MERISRWPIDEPDAEEGRLLGSAAVVVGAFDVSRPILNAAVAGLRTQSRLAHLARALPMQGWSALCVGDWKVAIPVLDEAARLARETGETAWAAGARAMQAMIAAVCRQPDDAQTLALEAAAAAATIGATHMLAYIHLARSFVALGAGRAAEAYEELLHIYQPDDPAYHAVPRCWYVSELTEASGGGDGTVRLWDTRSWRAPGHAGGPRWRGVWRVDLGRWAPGNQRRRRWNSAVMGFQ